MKLTVEKEPIKDAFFTANDKEPLTWPDVATGGILAASNFFQPLTINTPWISAALFRSIAGAKTVRARTNDSLL